MSMVRKMELISILKIIGWAFCKYCVLFYNDHVGKISHEKIGSLVFKPLITYYFNN